MQDEYNGVNGAEGAGAQFDKKKKECLNLAKSFSVHISVDSATAGAPKQTPDLDSATAAVIDWANKK